MIDKKACLITGGLAVVVLLVIGCFPISKPAGNVHENDTDGTSKTNNLKSDSPEKKQDQKLAWEEKLKILKELKKRKWAENKKNEKKRKQIREEYLFSRKIKEYQFDVPEPCYENADIKTGQMFLYGQYLPPPYKVEIIDERLFLNGIPLVHGLRADIYSDVKVRPEIRASHEANVSIVKMMGQTDFDNKNEVDKLLTKIKKIDAVEDAMFDKKRCRLRIKYKGIRIWNNIISGCQMKGLTEEEKRKQFLASIRKTKERIEKRLRSNGVIFWFSKGRLWGGMSAEEVRLLAKKIDEIFKKPKPTPQQTVGDFADERRQIKELTDRFSDPEILEIISNWKRR